LEANSTTTLWRQTIVLLYRAVPQALYRLSDASRELIKGCTEEMCRTSWMPRGIDPLDPADAPLLEIPPME
jgi:hypothetical protein